ncbi:hypothetical protein Tco_1482612 [Tanacetum coccineum]
MSKLKAGFLTAYMESLGSTFSNGANFAVVGSSTLPKFVPFALNVQVMHFPSPSSPGLQSIFLLFPLCKELELHSDKALDTS